MARTWIDGDVNSMVILADATYANLVTTDSGYAWGIKTSKQAKAALMKGLSQIEAMDGTVKIIEGKFAAEAWAIKEAILDSYDKYTKLLDALNSWKTNSTLLYLYVINEWGTGASYNLALTLGKTALTGFVRNFQYVPEPQTILVSFEFHYSEAV
jgi:hypothetical protein